MRAKLTLRIVALGYLLLLLLLPLSLVFFRTFQQGFDPFVEVFTSADAQHAFWMTLLMVAIAVPANTIFGIACAIYLVRGRGFGRRIVNTLIDLPFAISPVVIGLALVLTFGQNGMLGGLFSELGIRIIFSWPGMVIATVFVSLPFVVREVEPVLREVGLDQEDAAATLGASRWQTFLRVTLPTIRWGVAYGVVLTTARALGEYGAVAIVSGKVAGSTQTLTLLVEERFHQFDLAGAYVASLVLAVIALVVLILMHRFKPKGADE